MAQTKDIRNVCLISHSSSGKTSLAEAMLYNNKLIDRFGKVEDGTTVSDYDSEEIKRKISINTSLISFNFGDTKLNVLDTPGFFDFVGEQIEACEVCDNAIIPISGKSGVNAGTEKAWKLCEKYGLGKILFVINNMLTINLYSRLGALIAIIINAVIGGIIYIFVTYKLKVIDTIFLIQKGGVHHD